MTTCGTGVVATTLFEELTAGESFELPAIDLDGTEFTIPIADLSSLIPVTNAALTSSDGSGTFDILVNSIRGILDKEYRSNRINGAEYVRSLIELIVAALNNSVTFALQRDQSVIQAETAKVQLAAARIAATEAKVRLATALIEARNQAIALAKGKVELALADAQYCTAKYTLETMLPEQLALQVVQKETAQYQLTEILPKQAVLTEAQTATTNADTFNKLEQNQLIKEQVEAARAATLDTRRDGSPVAGSTGVEKALHTQQKISFELSSKLNAAKMFADAYTVAKTADNATLPPAAFANPSLQGILESIISSHGLGTP